ncbi:OsmC family protein [Mucilaginibacter flavidus]|uniref:OsmC family protein n=1 Tax=Mucilaginibacter flavidus TaxID=2949309 RepID=UPI00209336F8|nr:OsmC family protein [Mucilaginibacter flavidus]MCO5946776.1 OsmC family protein [Mucilaginibacter flavidus]
MATQQQCQVKLNWVAGRKGILESSVLNRRIEVATPPEFPNDIPGIWSPEHLFIGAVNSCFMTSFLAIAENSKLDFVQFECNAVGILDKKDGRYIVSQITLYPVVTLNYANEKAMRVIEMSEKSCLISNSIKTHVHLQAQIKLQNNEELTKPNGIGILLENN